MVVIIGGDLALGDLFATSHNDATVLFGTTEDVLFRIQGGSNARAGDHDGGPMGVLFLYSLNDGLGEFLLGLEVVGADGL